MLTINKRPVRLLCAAVALMGAASGNATDLEDLLRIDNSSLQGAYGFTITQSCVRGPFQPPPAKAFDPVTGQLLVNGEVINSAGSGVMRFARNGVVNIENGVLSELSFSQLAPGQKPLSVGTRFTCGGNYVRQPGNKLAVTLSCNVATPQPGITITLGPLDFEGFIASLKQSINLSSVSGSINKVTVSSGTTVVQERERMCVQSMSLDKI